MEYEAAKYRGILNTGTVLHCMEIYLEKQLTIAEQDESGGGVSVQVEAPID